MPDLKDIRHSMTGFNQLVFKNFKIQKFFVSLDLPLSRINNVQAQNIADLDRYLVAKAIKGVSSPHHSVKGTPINSVHTLTSGGSPDINLLSEFKHLQSQNIPLFESQGPSERSPGRKEV